MTKSVISRRQFIGLGLTSATGLVGISGCTVSEIRRSIQTGHQVYQGQYSNAIASQVPGVGIPEIDGIVRQQLANFLDQISRNWQDKRVPGPKTYVKYTDHYLSRAIINFEAGIIQVETVATKQSKIALKKAIVHTLLTSDDPTTVDLYSAKAPKVGKTPFLIDLVRDHDQQPIRYQWRANRFADYLLKHHYRKLQGKNQVRHQVSFNMVTDYKNQQSQHYRYAVLQNAKRFGIQPALIYSIIETESSFNPYAVSSAPAYGLMQIVPTTAGRDVYRLLNQRDGTPSKQMLFAPATNIQYGTAYLSILKNRYLSGINDPIAKEYCIIAAYNTGSGNVLRSFDRDRHRAIQKINRLSRQQVYQHLRQNLSSQEAKNYLAKVVSRKPKYQLG